MNKPSRRGKLVFMVFNRESISGFSVRADSHEDAARRARKYRTMRDATAIEVRRFCGPAGSSNPITFTF